MSRYDELIDSVASGQEANAKKLTQELLDQGVDAKSIIDDALIPAMDQVGKKFQNKEIFVPEMLINALTMREAMKIIEPHITDSQKNSKVKFILGTVAGDLHDIGKDIVGMMLEGAGFEVIDMGIDVSSEDFVSAVKSNQAAFLGLSALLTTTMPRMKEIIAALADEGIRNNVKVLIGGAPVTESYAKEIGADAYAKDASAAVEAARSLLV